MKKILAAFAVIAGGGASVALSLPGPNDASGPPPKIRKAKDALESEYNDKLNATHQHAAPARCSHTSHQGRHIARCGFETEDGLLANRGYWEIEIKGDDVLLYAMNGEALRALSDISGPRFKPGYGRPYLDINTLDSAAAN